MRLRGDSSSSAFVPLSPGDVWVRHATHVPPTSAATCQQVAWPPTQQSIPMRNRYAVPHRPNQKPVYFTAPYPTQPVSRERHQERDSRRSKD